MIRVTSDELGVVGVVMMVMVMLTVVMVGVVIGERHLLENGVPAATTARHVHLHSQWKQQRDD